MNDGMFSSNTIATPIIVLPFKNQSQFATLGFDEPPISRKNTNGVNICLDQTVNHEAHEGQKK
jgi:hypothetical protein